MEPNNQPIIMQPLPKKKLGIKFKLPKLRKPDLSKLTKRQKLVCLLVVVIAVGAIGFGVYEFVNRGNGKNPVVAEVGDKKLYLSDFKARLFAATKKGTPQSPVYINEEAQKEVLLNSMIELAILDKFFVDNNISTPQDDIASAAAKYGGDYYANGDENTRRIFENYVRLDLERKIYVSELQSWEKGYAMVCAYDRARQSDYDLNTANAQELLAKQTTYAKDYCDKLKTRLESGSDVQQEAEALANDATLGNEIWRPNRIKFYYTFDKDRFERGRGAPISYNLIEQIADLKDATNKYTIIKVQDDSDPNNKYDAAYAVVYIESENNGLVQSPYVTWLTVQKEKLNAHTYAEKVKL